MPKPQVTANKSVSALCEMYLTLHASKKKSGDSDRQLLERFIQAAWDDLFCGQRDSPKLADKRCLSSATYGSLIIEAPFQYAPTTASQVNQRDHREQVQGTQEVSQRDHR